MAYFIDNSGILLFDVSIEIINNGIPIKTITGKCGDSAKETLAGLYEANNLYGCGAKYNLTWHWKAENQSYNALIDFLRGPIDTVSYE